MRARVGTACIRDAIRVCLDSLLVGVNNFIIDGNGIAQFICKNADSGARALEDAGNRYRFLWSPSVCFGLSVECNCRLPEAKSSHQNDPIIMIEVESCVVELLFNCLTSWSMLVEMKRMMVPTPRGLARGIFGALKFW